MQVTITTLTRPGWRLPLAVLLVIGCLGGGLLAARELFIPKKQAYTVQFDTALGIYKGNSVDVLGFPVGRVTALRQSGDHVDVSIEVAGDVKVPRDVDVVVTRPGIVTDRRLELTPAYRGGPTLASGAVIGRHRTHQPIEIDQVLKSIDSLLGELTVDGTLGRAIGQSADFIDGRGRTMRQAIASLKDTSGIGADNAEDIARMIEDLAIVAKTVRANRDDVRDFTDNVKAVSDSLGPEADQVSETLAQLSRSMVSIQSVVTENRADALAAVNGSEAVVATLLGRIREVQETLDIMPLAFQNLSRAIDTENGGLRVAHVWQASIFGSGLLQQLCTADPTFFCAIGLGIASDLGIGAS